MLTKNSIWGEQGDMSQSNEGDKKGIRHLLLDIYPRSLGLGLGFGLECPGGCI